MNVSYFFAVHIVLLLLTSVAQGAPFFDLFFGNPNRGRRPKSYYPTQGGYNEYKNMCKVLNPDPYAFIGSNPYPGVPFCPP